MGRRFPELPLELERRWFAWQTLEGAVRTSAQAFGLAELQAARDLADDLVDDLVDLARYARRRERAVGSLARRAAWAERAATLEARRSHVARFFREAWSHGRAPESAGEEARRRWGLELVE